MKTLLAALLIISFQTVAFADSLELNCDPVVVMSKSGEEIEIQFKRADVVSRIAKGDELITISSPVSLRWREINGHSAYVESFSHIEDVNVNGGLIQSIYEVKLKLDSILVKGLKLKSKFAVTVCNQL